MQTHIEFDGGHIQLERAAKGQIPALYTVWHYQRSRNVPIGMLEKYRNNRSETHPWKAFAGIGMKARYIGAFYDGREAALEAVLNA